MLVAEWYKSTGKDFFFSETSIISTWFGTFFSTVIQDRSDSEVIQTFRGSTKGWKSGNKNAEPIEIYLPGDFGKPDYYKRRKYEIDKCLKNLKSTTNLSDYFEMLVDKSESLRDYLWVNEDFHVSNAKIALQIIPKDTVIICLNWAIQDFWNRRSGWPDLFIYNDNEYLFVEAKAPNDELSDDQVKWFEWAIKEAKIPCRVCRVKESNDEIAG